LIGEFFTLRSPTDPGRGNARGPRPLLVAFRIVTGVMQMITFD
jgi:hypothetical protein